MGKKVWVCRHGRPEYKRCGECRREADAAAPVWMNAKLLPAQLELPMPVEFEENEVFPAAVGLMSTWVHGDWK